MRGDEMSESTKNVLGFFVLSDANRLIIVALIT